MSSLSQYMKTTGMTAEEAFEDMREDAMLLSRKLIAAQKRIKELEKTKINNTQGGSDEKTGA